ncbi:MAG: FKBP-type peptidyl-prolyl cis-trans isomerase [Treponema sp.]|nr:FKBP-type peptidyl-prolyl cis-trans isomerase [Treponema sp.]
MKKAVWIFLVGSCVVGAAFASGKAEQVVSKTDNSYAMGMLIGEDLKESGLDINYAAFARGLRETIEGNPRFDVEEAVALVRNAFNVIEAERNVQFQAEEQQFLATNAQKEGIKTTASGLQYEIIAEGTGNKPTIEDTVSIQYEGKLPQGTIFDSSYARGAPEEFQLDSIIQGFSEGLQLIQEGGTIILYIPSHLAYGPQGIAEVIPPYSVLIFKVELLTILEK